MMSIHDDDVDMFDPNLLDIHVNLPDILRQKVFKDEHSVNLLKTAIVIFNQGLEMNPMDGFGKVICFKYNKLFEYDFSIRNIIFNPTLDLENMDIVAKLLFNKNYVLDVKSLVSKRVIEFFLTGPFTEKSNGDIKTIVIKKLKNRVDSTRFFENPIEGVLDKDPFWKKQLGDKKPLKNIYDIDYPNNWKAAWNSWHDFKKTLAESELREVNRLSAENFRKWGKTAKELAKKVDSNHSS